MATPWTTQPSGLRLSGKSIANQLNASIQPRDLSHDKIVMARAVIDNARIDESTKKPYRLSISKKAQQIDSYAN